MVIATLEVNLSALRANYRLLRERHAKKNVAAVVKANAYGLGVEEVSNALWSEGCREFFVATLEEGVQLRAVLPEANIAVFSGIFAGEEKEFLAHRLMPVLNDVGMVERWRGEQKILHIDTGMTRLGLSQSGIQKIQSLIPNPQSLTLMSHLACANSPSHPKNAEQLLRFQEALKLFPNARASLANSAGIFLSPEFHFDVARPGCALYGINPHDGANPMQHVATLSAPILQIRTLDRDETVGYGATASLKKGERLAIVGLGYADGYFRKLSNLGVAYVVGHKVPVVGRVSMDMIALDVSALPELPQGVRAEFINSLHTVDDVARAAETIGYEIFTRIGRRVQRVYSQ